MDRALPGDCEVGIVRGPVLAAWKNHADPRGFLRTEGGGAHAGLGAHRHGHVLVADLRGRGSLGEILGVHRVASGIVVADAGDGAFAGFTADLRGLDAVGDHKTRIGKPLVDPVHDFAPDRFVEGGSTVVDAAVL